MLLKKWEELGRIDGKRKQKLVWVCPYYRAWTDMLVRCYSTKFQYKYPTYKGCGVSEVWLTFSNFKNWMITQDWEGKCLDKDILFEGNKVYGEDTCVFISQMVNSFITNSGASRGKYLIGTCWFKSRNKFQANCSNPFTKKKEYLGLFTTELEAHNVWLSRKLELAHELADIQEDPRVAKALIDRYTNYTI